MNDPLRHVKPAVRALSAYTLAAREARVKINQNENPHELPEGLKRRVLEQALARSWGRYPAFAPEDLHRALAAHAGWVPEGVLVGNGSNELIEALLRVTVGEGTPVVVPQPSFSLYALLVRILGGRLVPVELGPRLEYDLPAIAAARRQAEAPLTIVCSPNNPTGSVMTAAEVEALCAAGDGLVAVDEAYVEFAGGSVVPLLARHPNLVVLRTFSKALALAGLRVGYLLASPALVREVDKARLPYNLNLVSHLAALAVLEDGATLAASVAAVVEERARVADALSRMEGLAVHPSAANFLLVELRDRAPREVFEALHARGVLVRDVSSAHRLARCLRITIGTPTENDAFLDALRKILTAPAPVASNADRSDRSAALGEGQEATGGSSGRHTASPVAPEPLDGDRRRPDERGSARGRDAAPPRINEDQP